MAPLDAMNLQTALIALDLFIGVSSFNRNRWLSAFCFATCALLLNTYVKFAIVLAVKGSAP